MAAEIHTHQPPGETSEFAQETINGPGHFLPLAALRADDNAGVTGSGAVQPDKVPAIVGEKDAPFASRKCQHFIVGGSVVPETATDDAIEIVAESRERRADLAVEILVREKPPHRSGGGVVGNGAVDFLAMRGAVAAGGFEMLLAQ